MAKKTRKQEEAQELATHCRICGKPLTREESRKAGIGPECEGKTPELLQDMKVHRTVKELPEGYVKLSAVLKKAKELGVPTYRVMKAIGGNRGLDPRRSEDWEFVYNKHSRWLPEAALEDVRNLLTLKDVGIGPDVVGPEEAPASITDPIDLSVAEIRKMAKDLSDKEKAEMLILERNMKNRKTVIQALGGTWRKKAQPEEEEAPQPKEGKVSTSRKARARMQKKVVRKRTTRGREADGDVDALEAILGKEATG